MTRQVTCSGREILEHDFDGDVDAYAEHNAGPKPDNVEKDPDHPWHQRYRMAKLTIDLPDDSVLPREYHKLFTRTEVCELFEVSDSGFGKWKIPPRGRSGKYTLYALTDVFAYNRARAWIRGHRDSHAGKPPSKSIHQLAAMITAEHQNEDGPAKFWTPPNEPQTHQGGLFK